MFIKNLNNLTDEQLVELCKQDNQDAIGVLYKRFIGTARKIAYNYVREHNIPEIYKEDLFDVAVDSFFRAIKKFENNGDRVFLNFWWTITLRAFATFIKKVVASKIYYYDPAVIESSSYSMSDISNREETIILSNYFDEILKKNKYQFSDVELSFLKYFLAGYKVSEIAKEMNLSKSKVYRLRVKVIDKLNMIIKSN